MARTLFVGDISLDISLVAPHVPSPDEKVHCTACHEGLGGVITNTAVAFARAGGEAVLSVQLGDDQGSSEAARLLGAEGLIFRPHVIPGALCRVVTLLEPHGEKRLLLYPGVSLFPAAESIAELDLTDCTHLHTACFGPAWHDLIARARDHGLTWSLDLEPASFAGGIAQLAPALAGADLVFCNDGAAKDLGESPVETLFEMGVRAVVRTRGAAGASYHLPHEETMTVSAPQGMPIVDTTGAGDCFAGWFLAGRSAGIPLEHALKRAAEAASFSCEKVGAQAGYPTAGNFEINSEWPRDAR